MAKPSIQSKAAGVVIDILVALGIAMILFTLWYPASPGGIIAANKTVARNDAAQIATAIDYYLQEYHSLPTSPRTDMTVADDPTQSRIMDALCPPNVKSPPAENARGITFLEIPKANKDGRNGRVNGAGPYLDPWGRAYFIALDGNGDGFTRGPADDNPRGAKIHRRVLVWSQGDPNREDYENPAKWIKSWE